jgi:hypothetical protein
MRVPVDITFRGIPTSIALQATIERWADRLRWMEPTLRRCSVVVRRTGGRSRRTGTFEVHLEVALAEHQIIVDREPIIRAEPDDPFVAVDDAFRAARSQLPDRTNAQELRGARL